MPERVTVLNSDPKKKNESIEKLTMLEEQVVKGC